jgi:hypothetical protein
MQTEARPNLGLPTVGEGTDDDAKPTDDDERFWSVTTIIGALDKPALVPWAAIETAKAAVDSEKAWKSRLENEGRESAIEFLKGARFRRARGARSATELGTVVHALCEEYALTGNRPVADAETRPYLDRFDEFLQHFSPEYIAAEIVVFSPTYGYAGQTDGFLRIQDMDFVVDYKTSVEGWDAKGNPKTPYPEVGLQLAAYRYADMAAVWRARRFEKYRRRYYLLSEAEKAMGVPVPPVDGGLAIFLSPQRYGVYPIKCDESVFEAFLYTIEAARWSFQTSKTVVGAPLIPPNPFPTNGDDPFRGLPT